MLLNALPHRVLNATVRLIGDRHGELSPPVSFTYQTYAVGAKRSSYQAQSRMAWLKCIAIEKFKAKYSSELLEARRRRMLGESSDALSASVARPPRRPLRLVEPCLSDKFCSPCHTRRSSTDAFKNPLR